MMYNVYFHNSLPTLSQSGMEKVTQSWRRVAESVKMCQADPDSCGTIEVLNQVTKVSRMTSQTVGFTLSSQTGSFVIEQICRGESLQQIPECFTLLRIESKSFSRFLLDKPAESQQWSDCHLHDILPLLRFQRWTSSLSESVTDIKWLLEWQLHRCEFKVFTRVTEASHLH
jgi:hypothetical protein